MITTTLDFTADLGTGLAKTRLAPWFVAGDKQAHTFRVAVLDGGTPAILTGAGCAAYVIRADGVTVPVYGSVTGNVASVTLPASCYTVPGRIAVIIRLSTNAEINTIFYGEGAVLSSTTDSVVDPGGLIPSLDELLAQIAAMEAATAAANTATANAQAQAQAAATAASNAQTKANEASSAAEEATNAAAFFDVLEASATALPPGSTPTAAWEDTDGKKKLLLGIPRGEKGETGSIDNLTINGQSIQDGNITLTAADIPVSATDDTTVQTALIQRDRVVSLLDNGDFRHLVNQRGQTNYTANVYTIDRWLFATTSGGAMNVQYGDVRMYSPGDGYTNLSQIIADSASLAGKPMTFAVKRTDGTLFILNYVHGTNDEAFYDDGRLHLIYWENRIHIRIQNTGDQWIAFAWAVLYPGTYTADTLPAYVPKGYAAELLACQRYYTEGTAKLGWVFSSESAPTAYLCDVTYPVPMRVNPTVTIKNIKLWSAQAPASITAAKNIGDNHGFNSLNLSGSANGAVIQFDYAASADL